MSTKHWGIKHVVLVAMGISLLLGKSAALAQQPQVSDMLQKYGQTSAPRDFVGTLYCIRCNFSPTPENLATCDKEGHAHFLLMEDGHEHPLYGVNKTIADKINAKEMHEKKVTIRGIFYPVSNAILVGDVRPAAQ
jgi:hypothetical protein